VAVNGEAIRAPMHWVPFDGIPRIYDTLRDLPHAVVVEIPLYRRNVFFGNARYMLYATRHHHPLVNGYSGFAPAGYNAIVRRLSRFPDSTSLEQLHELGVTHVVIHRNRLHPRAQRAIDGSPALEPIASEPPITIFRVRPVSTVR
jgi:hypothetical protein